MLIRMKPGHTSAGPTALLAEDYVYDVPEEMGHELIELGAAIDAAGWTGKVRDHELTNDEQ